MKTLLVALALVGTTSGVQALPQAPDAQLQFFAACAGRLSATAEHQSIFDGRATDQTMHQHQTLVELIDAIMPEGRGKDVRNWQLHAKVAHSGLLSRAALANDSRVSREAERLAGLYLAECTQVLLG